MQRHHLLPRQLLSARCFGRFVSRLGSDRIGIDDFRRNGLLLPGTERAAIRFGLPLHRGPHRAYSAMVFERVGQIEHRWAARRASMSCAAAEEALMRLALLQKALRRRLLADRAKLLLNRADPLATGRDFAELDAIAELLWRDSGAATIPSPVQPAMRTSS
jgi:hypothetical protein